MFKFFKNFFQDNIEFLPTNYCEGKSNKELLDTLRKRNISMASGNMIVLELLERLIKKDQ